MKIKLQSMAFKIFLDANVLLDFMLKRANYINAAALIKNVIDGKSKAFVTPAIIHITAYWLTKAYGSKKAKELLLALLMDVTVVDITHQITLLALHSKIDDIEEALQYYTALHHRFDYFISEDKALQKAAIPALPVISAAYFLNKVAG